MFSTKLEVDQELELDEEEFLLDPEVNMELIESEPSEVDPLE